ncbi:MAG: hypothetical protein N3F64_00395 [Nitrososphaeria archaeon]|nr:hypothetical protein [Nitrososphaeria archaeon]
MQRIQKILAHINSALEAIKSLEKNVISRNSLLEFDKLIWEAYKNCEAAIFLIKIEIKSIDEFDDSKLLFDQNYIDYNIFVAEECISNAISNIRNGRLREALKELRNGRNILAELFIQSRKEKINRIRENFKHEKTNV